MSRSMSKLSKGVVLVLGLLIMAYLTVMKFTTTGYMAMETSEYIQFYPITGFEWLWFSFVSLTLVVLLILVRHLSEKVIFFLGMMLYMFLGSSLILGVEAVPRSDPRYVWETAIALNHGDYSTFLEQELSNYLSIFPNQIGLVTIFRLFAQLSEDIRLIWFIQLGLVVVNIFLIWGITKLLFKEPMVSKTVLLTSFLFLPSLLLVLWAYGDILGLTGALFASYCLILFEQSGSKNWFLPIIACYMLVLSITVRSNYAIFALALICVYILKFFRKINWFPVTMIAMLSLSFVLPNQINQLLYQRSAHQMIPKGTPLKAWVVMGLGTKAANPGYWDGYTTLLPIWHQFNQESMRQQVDDDFVSRVEELTTDRQAAKEFFAHKIQVTWNEPTYQSIYVGPLKPRDQEAKTDFLKNLYEEGLYYQIYHSYMTGLTMLIYSLCFIAILSQLFGLFHGKAVDEWQLLFLLFMIGGFIFHLLWETKSRYVYPHVFVMLPYFALGSYQGLTWLKLLKDKLLMTIRSTSSD